MFNVTVVGAGDISSIYLYNLKNVFHGVKVRGVYDIQPDRAGRAAETWGIPRVFETLSDAVSDPETDLILNLTRPLNHYEVSKAAILAGKHILIHFREGNFVRLVYVSIEQIV